MASVASQLIEEVTAHAQSDSLEDARKICADGTYFPNNLRNLEFIISFVNNCTFFFCRWVSGYKLPCLQCYASLYTGNTLNVFLFWLCVFNHKYMFMCVYVCMSMADVWIRLNCWIQCWRPVTTAAFYVMSIDQNSTGSVHIQSILIFLESLNGIF